MSIKSELETWKSLCYTNKSILKHDRWIPFLIKSAKIKLNGMSYKKKTVELYWRT